MDSCSECPLTAQLSRLEQWSNITLFSSKYLSRLHLFGQKSCQVYFSVMYCMRWESGKEQTLKHWRRRTHLNLHARRLNAKEVLSPMQGEKFVFPIADATVTISGEDQDLRTSTLIRDSPDRGEEQDHLRGESDGSSSTPTTRFIVV